MCIRDRAYRENRELLRFHVHRPQKLLEQLSDLQREPLHLSLIHIYYVEITENGKIYEVENEAGVGFTNMAQTGSLRIEKTSSDGKVEASPSA